MIKARSEATLSELSHFVCAFAVAAAPILQHYKGFINGGLTILLLAFPFALFGILQKTYISARSLSVLITLVIFFAYKVVDHGVSLNEFGSAALILFYSLVFCTRSIDAKYVVKIVTYIACLASVLIIVQYFCYYILGFHLRLVPTSLLLDSAEQWVLLAKTGRVSITGKAISFYRPSAFFLEPSHMYIYMAAPLLFEVLSMVENSKNYKKAVLLSLGMLLSTSGMGIVAMVAIWLLYLGKRGGRNHKLSLKSLLRPRNVMILLGVVAVLVVLYFEVDFFQRSVNRILFSGEDYNNAVAGRLRLGNKLIRKLQGTQLIFGNEGSDYEVEFHLTGFNATIYKFGIIGMILSYLFYVKSMIDLKEQYFWLAVLLIATSFFMPHTHGTFYMLMFIVILINGYQSQRSPERITRFSYQVREKPV